MLSYLVHRPTLNKVLACYGHIILPLFLMALGGWIIFETKAYARLSSH